MALGGRIFRGDEDGGPCIGCHGADARAARSAATSTGGKWLWANGTLSSIRQIIENGVPHPKAHACPDAAQGRRRAFGSRRRRACRLCMEHQPEKSRRRASLRALVCDAALPVAQPRSGPTGRDELQSFAIIGIEDPA